jgi:hypothetical protein
MALMRSFSFAGVLLAALALSGCAGLPSLSGGGGAKPVDLNTVPRDKLAAFGAPIMRVTIPNRGIDTLVSPRETKGDVTTWESAEGFTFTFRSGVLIATRGLGPDLMSAAVPSPGQLASGGATRRSYFYTWENDANQRRDYSCVAQNQGQQAVTIYGRSHATRHIVETCTRESGRLANEFWVEGGSIRQSKQWISPLAGPGYFYRVID